VDARKKAVEDGVPEEELPSLDPPEGGDEEDPEAPKLEEMINEKKEKYVQ
jgi:adenylate/nucleoside-diphosphate kinase